MTAPAALTGTSRRCLDKAGEHREINKVGEQRGLIKRTEGDDGVCVQDAGRRTGEREGEKTIKGRGEV